MPARRGFVDLQVNGLRGVDFAAPDLTEAQVVEALRGLIADGTAVLLPTVITAAAAVYERNLPMITAIAGRPEFAPHVPGLHLEGPFLSPKPGAAGAHNPAWMQAAEPAALDRLQSLARGRIRLLTIAAEIPGAPALIAHARTLGITVSLGHSLAGFAETAAARAAGAAALTHLGNGIPHQIDRHSNPVYAGLAEDTMTAMVIGDGHHVPWDLVRLMLRVKGSERFVLVSDASPMAGMPPGTYPCLGATAVISPEGRLYNPATGYLMGSSATIRQVVNASRKALGLDDATIHALAIANPLRLIGEPVPAGLPDLPRDADGAFLAPVEPS
jgi:N-acetylglucosamine-6-phosphate deacetylase